VPWWQEGVFDGFSKNQDATAAMQRIYAQIGA
jgi:hypothetical protein